MTAQLVVKGGDGPAIAAALRRLIKKIPEAYRNGEAERFIAFIEGQTTSPAESLKLYKYELTHRRQQHKLKNGKAVKKMLSAGAVNQNLKAAKALLRALVESGAAVMTDLQEAAVQIAMNKTKLLDPGPVGLRAEKMLTEEERLKLIEALPNDGMRLLSAFLLYTALRISEALNLRRDQVAEGDLRCTFHLIGKGGKGREGYVNRGLYDAIVAYFNDQEYLFGKDGKPAWTRQAFTATLGRYARKAIGRSISAHALRHTAISHLYQVTGNIRLAQQLAGHSDVSTTSRIYEHVQPAPEQFTNVMDGILPTK